MDYAKNKGRKAKDRFAMVPHSVLRSEAVKSLSPAAFRTLVAYAANYNGYNNGSLGLGSSQAEEWGVPKRTLQRTKLELEKRGLIVRTRQGTRTPPRPTFYALTWLNIDVGNHELTPTKTARHDYRSWPPTAISDTSDRHTAIRQDGTRKDRKGSQ